jgi:hypothetical protein
MILWANGISFIHLLDDGVSVLMGLAGEDGSVMQIAMPLEGLFIGRSQFQRLVEVHKQRHPSGPGQFELIPLSAAKTIEPRGAFGSPHMYFLIDRGQQDEVAYSLPIEDAVELEASIGREYQRWLDGQKSPGKLQ